MLVFCVNFFFYKDIHRKQQSIGHRIVYTCIVWYEDGIAHSYSNNYIILYTRRRRWAVLIPLWKKWVLAGRVLFALRPHLCRRLLLRYNTGHSTFLCVCSLYTESFLYHLINDDKIVNATNNECAVIVVVMHSGSPPCCEYTWRLFFVGGSGCWRLPFFSFYFVWALSARNRLPLLCL